MGDHGDASGQPMREFREGPNLLVVMRFIAVSAPEEVIVDFVIAGAVVVVHSAKSVLLFMQPYPSR